ncbi:hypothetical protein CDCA_CDCA04G1357 [Cyanidium caldarium]|uniref:Uncharacterized protein n=1 Tax=Cyanidium caldarium TaxID=2771 RepID=A0AAV9ISL8_CYACA|nr:hypothetical protein CDCA_CDCA04G1357 [Cyanidium caldarium]
MTVRLLLVQRKVDGHPVAHCVHPDVSEHDARHLVWRVANYMDPRNVHACNGLRLDDEEGGGGAGEADDWRRRDAEAFQRGAAVDVTAGGGAVTPWSSGGYHHLGARRLAGAWACYWQAPPHLFVLENLGLVVTIGGKTSSGTSGLRAAVLWTADDGDDEAAASSQAQAMLSRVAEAARRYDKSLGGIALELEEDESAPAEGELSLEQIVQRCRLNMHLFHLLFGTDPFQLERQLQDAPLSRAYDRSAMAAWRERWQEHQQRREQIFNGSVVFRDDPMVPPVTRREPRLLNTPSAPEKEGGKATEGGDKKRKKTRKSAKGERGERRKKKTKKKAKATAEESADVALAAEKRADPSSQLPIIPVPYMNSEFMRKAWHALRTTMFGETDSGVAAAAAADWDDAFVPLEPLDAVGESDQESLDLELQDLPEARSEGSESEARHVNLWLIDDAYLNERPELAAELFERAPYFDAQRLLGRIYDAAFCERATSYFKAVFYLLEHGHFKEAYTVLQQNIMDGMVRKVRRTSQMPRTKAPKPASEASASPGGTPAAAAAAADAVADDNDAECIAGEWSDAELAGEEEGTAAKRPAGDEATSTQPQPQVEEMDEEGATSAALVAGSAHELARHGGPMVELLTEERPSSPETALDVYVVDAHAVTRVETLEDEEKGAAANVRGESGVEAGYIVPVAAQEVVATGDEPGGALVPTTTTDEALTESAPSAIREPTSADDASDTAAEALHQLAIQEAGERGPNAALASRAAGPTSADRKSTDAPAEDDHRARSEEELDAAVAEPPEEHKRLYLLACWYKLALHLLEQITTIDRTAATGNRSPEDERALAHMCTLLAYLPLLPPHRSAAVNVSIEKNVQLGNYGYATGWIDWAYDRCPAADATGVRARYHQLLDECEDHAWQNEYVVPEADRLMEYYGRGALSLREYLLLAREEVSGLWTQEARTPPVESESEEEEEEEEEEYSDDSASST